MAWYHPSWLYRQKITIDHTLVAEDLTDFPVLITDTIVQADLFAHARSDGADIVVTAGDEITKLKRELVTYDAVAGDLELYVRIPSLSSLTVGSSRAVRWSKIWTEIPIPVRAKCRISSGAAASKSPCTRAETALTFGEAPRWSSADR